MEIVEIIKLGGPVVGVVAIFAWLIYKLVCKILPVVDKLHDAVNANTKITNEMYVFLKGLNGRLKNKRLKCPKNKSLNRFG